MAVTVGITHHTAYEYDKPINMGPHVFRLKPAAHCRTTIKSYSLKITPEDHYINWQQDPFGNYLARVVFPEKTKSFSFTVDVVAQLDIINPFDFFLETTAEKFPFKYEERLKADLNSYLELEETEEAFKYFVEGLKPEKPMVTADFLVAINSKVNQLLDYTIRLEPGVQSCDESMDKGSGSCRDSAWLLVQAFRYLGLAARFVSGYLVQLSQDEKSLDGPSGPDEDFTDLHAWCEVYVPGAGWIGLDPTSGLFAQEGHIPLACTPEPSSAAPVTGGIDECESELDYYNKVTRLIETPRITKPYRDDQWQDIEELAVQVEKQLVDQDVRLTMGGEPTFVSVDDIESDQWNTDADGEDKRKMAYELFLKMQAHYTKGAMLHFGQGKWYPGEALPRWQYGCYWLKDGQKIWKDQQYLADINKQYPIKDSNVKYFPILLSKLLGLAPECVVPTYEDVLYHLWQEGQMPVDPSPEQDGMLDSMSRKGFLQKLEKGLDKVVGYVLPITWDETEEKWQSCIWNFRREYCFLVPGESPVGYRLPLSSIVEDEELQENDPFAIEGALTLNNHKYKDRGYVSKSIIKTAMSFEIRDQKLYVFMPPLSKIEPYLALVNCVEETAVKLKIPVVLEGYEPPHDHRVQKFAVTPDPGVIEVNVHPVGSWNELNKNMTDLYELARSCRLSTNKFMVDGRHTGTGGGNHVTLGGSSPKDSPFLRRPDVLRSFITYWQHHPGLSYLFSGLFIGPTSQAPRVDEARDEALYELEIAFAQMKTGESDQPWLVDRLLRNLLTDLTGNTHRAEFCIDKLYSPDSPTGRLGIVEFRGFEMPPHSKMALMQMLLIRTLLAWFWKKPYHKPLVRWGTQLHDKFLLPHYVEQDIQNVCQDLQQEGFKFDESWFTPFFEFRFQICGIRQLEDMQIELRNAIEPWHVLGEESGGGGMARYVDSSLERVQIKIDNMTTNRYILSCNGRRVPLKETTTKSQMVAGIRFRAWQPPSALHPTIGVHAPLIFDLYDTWNGRSVGGFTYHVTHPGGRSFEQKPVNDFEAEGRRQVRFDQNGHSIPPKDTPVQMTYDEAGQYQSELVRNVTTHEAKKSFTVPAEELGNSDYPNTLDLRRNAHIVS
ncbi:DUF2126 domain-containing protein [Marinicellulosiphila megalodicopiae]|uniref:transglutaminase family protein n=1 Tax=Marinicellulosiphila megalodicopiae TaxID=2724896 RepID=UPI003BAFB3C9